MKGKVVAALFASLLMPSALHASTQTTLLASQGQSVLSTETDARIQERLRRAIVNGSLEDLLGLRSELELRSDSQEGKTEDSNQYTLAYINWRISQLLPENEKKERKRLLKQAQHMLDVILEVDANDVEAHSLRGGVIGERIGGFFGGMFLGPKASKSLKRAFELDPNNPRVALQRGVGYFYTPKTFGGGLERARQELERARELFVLETEEHPWPNWGRVDAIGWLGQVLAQSGKLEEAKALYEKALKLEPNHAWISLELLPALKALENAEH